QRGHGACARAREGRGPDGRHTRRDRQAPRDLPPRNRADRRALPHDRKAHPDPSRAVDRGRRRRDRRRAAGARMILRKQAAEIETMARAGAVVAGTLALIEEHLEPGVSTTELNELAEEYIRSKGG